MADIARWAKDKLQQYMPSNGHHGNGIMTTNATTATTAPPATGTLWLSNGSTTSISGSSLGTQVLGPAYEVYKDFDEEEVKVLKEVVRRVRLAKGVDNMDQLIDEVANSMRSL